MTRLEVRDASCSSGSRTGRASRTSASPAAPTALGGWRIDAEHRLLPDVESEAERFGIEDPRITHCGDEYLIVYTGYSNAGPLVCLASTRDFETFERRGILMPPEDKDAALFPRTFGGRWALIHRPVATQPTHAAHIWLSWSPDLRHWGDHTDPASAPARAPGGTRTRSVSARRRSSPSAAGCCSTTACA